MAYQQVDIYIKDTGPQKLPVPGVVINVYSFNGRLLHTQAVTDVDGHAGFLLEEETYQIRCAKFGVSFSNPKYIVVMDGANNFDIAATLISPPVPNDVRLCTAFGFFRDVTGAPAAFVDIQFISKFKPVLLEGAAVLTERAYVRTDESGYAQVNLIRFGKYDVTVAGFEDYQRCIEVPDAPNVNLPDLLFPVVQSMLFSPPIPATMTAGDADVQFIPSAVRSDGNVMDASQSVGAVQFSSSDPNVLALLIAGNVITLRPLSAGTAELRGVRNEQTIVRIPDLGITGLPAQVTVL